MYCVYHDQQFVATLVSKEMACLLVQAMLLREMGPGPYDPGIFDGTDKVIGPNGLEIDLLRELGQVRGITPGPQSG